MRPLAYYNEHDPRAAAWLRELISGGHIAPGDVDERSIADVRSGDLNGYVQAHFFAGIGGWSLALRLAGWPDERPVWTGSCPCQPFSAAGKGLAEKDERHLWPVLRDLITFGEPTITFGEQVASALGREWLAGVRADLEGLGYEVGAADLCAASAGEEAEGWQYIEDQGEGFWAPVIIGAPHIRQRLYWLAIPGCRRVQRQRGRGDASRASIAAQGKEDQRQRGGAHAGNCSATRGLAVSDGWHASAERQQRSGQHRQQSSNGGAGGLGDADTAGFQERERYGRIQREAVGALAGKTVIGRGDTGGAWSDFAVIPCRDGKARRVESGTFPLANGIPGRVGLLRGYGNAIVPQLAAEFIQACEEAIR